MIDLVPELLVKNIERSLIFWCDTCLFQIRYERLEEGFAYIEKRNAQLMLDEIGKNWITDELTYPFGRGINFQITVDSIAFKMQYCTYCRSKQQHYLHFICGRYTLCLGCSKVQRKVDCTGCKN